MGCDRHTMKSFFGLQIVISFSHCICFACSTSQLYIHFQGPPLYQFIWQFYNYSCTEFYWIGFILVIQRNKLSIAYYVCRKHWKLYKIFTSDRNAYFCIPSNYSELLCFSVIHFCDVLYLMKYLYTNTSIHNVNAISLSFLCSKDSRTSKSPKDTFDEQNNKPKTRSRSITPNEAA